MKFINLVALMELIVKQVYNVCLEKFKKLNVYPVTHMRIGFKNVVFYHLILKNATTYFNHL